MSKTFKQSKPVGFEYWSARPSKGLRQPGKITKWFTHRRERRAATREIRDEVTA